MLSMFVSDGVFGSIKYNISNGGPAPEHLTNRVYALTQKITQYKIAEGIPEVTNTCHSS